MSSTNDQKMEIQKVSEVSEVVEKIPCIDLFCGGGGWSQGTALSQTHFTALAIEWWDKGISLHANNFPKTDHVLMALGGDVTEFCDEIRAYVAKKGYENYHLHGSPPCQSFSNANRAIGHVVAEDKRSNLTTWYLEVIKNLQPTTWSMENVPGALTYLQGLDHEILKDEELKIFPAVYGYEFTAPTMRKRLIMGKGFDLSEFTTQKNGKRRKFTSEMPTMISATHTAPNPFKILLDENPTKTATDFAVRTSTMNAAASKSRGEKLNHRMCFESGEGLKTLDQVGYAQLASAQVDLYQKIDSTNSSEDNLKIILGTIKDKHAKKGIEYSPPARTFSAASIKPGTWKKMRPLKFSESAFIQGFPASYNAPSEITMQYWNSLQDLNAGKPATNATHKITAAHAQKIVGNSVIPLVASEIFRSMNY